MATFPTIVINTAGVTITTNNPRDLSYQQLIGTLVNTSYKIDSLYLSSRIGGYNQVSTPLTLTTPQSNGESYTEQYIGTIDTEQSQPTVYIDPDDNFVISTLTTLNFTMLPNASLDMDFYFDDTVNFGYLLNGSEIVNSSLDDNSDNSSDDTQSQSQSCDNCPNCLIWYFILGVTVGLAIVKIINKNASISR